jgi:hypothetical protein
MKIKLMVLLKSINYRIVEQNLGGNRLENGSWNGALGLIDRQVSHRFCNTSKKFENN